MDQREVIDTLNDLLALEQCNLATYLKDSTVFISKISIKDASLLDQMVIASTSHGKLLAETIVALGGTPGLRRVEMMTTDLHFQDLASVFPRLVEDRGDMVQRCSRAAERVSNEPSALRVVQQLHECHQGEWEALKSRANVDAALG